MKTCQTCGHWRPLPRKKYLGFCHSNQMLNFTPQKKKMKGDELIHDGYNITTGPSFGCVHHVEREGV